MILIKSKIYKTRIIDLKKDIPNIRYLCSYIQKIDFTVSIPKYRNQQGFINSMLKNYYKFAKYYQYFLLDIDRSCFMNMLDVADATSNYKLIDTLNNSSTTYKSINTVNNLSCKYFTKAIFMLLLKNKALKNYFKNEKRFSSQKIIRWRI